MFWNVNGSLAYKLSCSEFVDLLKRFDIIILIETKLTKSSFLDLTYLGFSLVIRNDRQSASGGVLIAAKTTIAPSINIFRNDPESEQVFISVHDRFVLGGVYIPPVGSKYYSDFDRFQHLQDCIEHILNSGKDYIIVGDFNGRFGNRSQKFIESDNNTVTVSRVVNWDKHVNSSGRKLLTLCHDCSSVIMTGKTWPGDFTCYSANGCSTVDTGICTDSMLESVSLGKVHSVSSLSDHVPISFCVAVEISSPTFPTVPSRKIAFKRSDIVKILRDPFRVNLLHNEILSNNVLQGFQSRIDDIFASNKSINKNEISTIVSDLYTCCEKFVAQFIKTSKRSGSRGKDVRKMGCLVVKYDKSCVEARRCFYQALRIFHRVRSHENYRILVRRRRIKNSHERRCRRKSE